MRQLARAIARRVRDDKSFTGSAYATAGLIEGVGHQQIVNLLDGTSRPWNVRVETQQAICNEFRDIRPEDFYKPNPA